MVTTGVDSSPFMEANDSKPSFTTIVNVDPFAGDSQVDPLQLRPGTIRQQAIGNLITSSHAGLGAAAYYPLTAYASTTSQVNFVLSDNLSRTIIGNPDIALFTGISDSSQRSTANQWPNASYGMSNLPWLWYNNFGLTDNINVVTSVAVRNNTASDVAILIAVRWRIETNNSATFEQGFIS